jgi:hypothetical protein
MEINHYVKREEVEAIVKQMMEGEEGKRMKNNALQWKKKAEAAASIGGSSYNNFNKFISEVLHFKGNIH